MSILPSMDVSLDTIANTINSVEQSSTGIALTEFKEYAWDFEKNDFMLVDGKFVILKGKEALRVWIWKALSTPRLRYEIYDENYGNDMDKLIGKGYSYKLIETEAKRFITECMTKNKYITGISDFKMQYEDNLFTISFTANTAFGDIDINTLV